SLSIGSPDCRAVLSRQPCQFPVFNTPATSYLLIHEIYSFYCCKFSLTVSFRAEYFALQRGTLACISLGSFQDCKISRGTRIRGGHVVFETAKSAFSGPRVGRNFTRESSSMKRLLSVLFFTLSFAVIANSQTFRGS